VIPKAFQEIFKGGRLGSLAQDFRERLIGLLRATERLLPGGPIFRQVLPAFDPVDPIFAFGKTAWATRLRARRLRACGGPVYLIQGYKPLGNLKELVTRPFPIAYLAQQGPDLVHQFLPAIG
jgi:hypothetical protein